MRRFTCKGCGGTFDVHPDLPPDYEPDVCDGCAALRRVGADISVGLMMRAMSRMFGNELSGQLSGRFYWKLDGHTPVPATSDEHADYWRAVLLGTIDQHVALHHDEGRDVSVSTIFLGLNIALSDPPRVFETLIRGGEHDGYQVRVATWDEAEAEHAKALRMVGMMH